MYFIKYLDINIRIKYPHKLISPPSPHTQSDKPRLLSLLSQLILYLLRSVIAYHSATRSVHPSVHRVGPSPIFKMKHQVFPNKLFKIVSEARTNHIGANTAVDVFRKWTCGSDENAKPADCKNAGKLA